MKKLNAIKIELSFFYFEIFCENHSFTRHIKYRVINFATSSKSIMANKLPFNQFGTVSLTD